MLEQRDALTPAARLVPHPMKPPARERQEAMQQSKNAASADRIEVLEDEAIEANPDVQTRRETFELDLMEQGRSKEGAFADLVEEAKNRRPRERERGSR